MENQVNRYELKIQALLEEVSNVKAESANKVADLRVDLTIKDQELRAAYQKIEELEKSLEPSETSETSEEDDSSD